MENDVYKEFKKAYYKLWDDIARHVKQAQVRNEGLHLIRSYKALWLVTNGYDRSKILYDCFTCTVCGQHCNECPVNDVLAGCTDVWLDDVCAAFSTNDYTKAYNWAIKIRDG